MATYVLNEEKMFADIADGVAIVINSETGIYYGMNNFGTEVFQQLLNGADTEAVIAALKEMEGAPADMEKRFNDFLRNTLDFEIFIPGETEGCQVEIDIDTAQKDSFLPLVQAFDDAQEMLLADPIHEVKYEKGWEPDKDVLETDPEIVKAKESKM